MIVPESARKEMLSRLHQGHLGIQKTISKAMDTVFWPGINKDIESLISRCEPCQLNQRNNPKETVITPTPASRPWEKISADIFDWSKSQYLLIVDDYSGFVEVSRLGDMKSTTVINKLRENFARYGIPQILLTDNGRQFVSEEFKDFVRSWDFKHQTSSPYYAQSNGLAERNVGTMKNLMNKCAQDKTDEYAALLNFRAVSRDSEISSPAERFFNRKLRTNVPIAEELLKPKVPKNVQSKLQEQREKAVEHVNKRGRKRLRELHKGERVLVRFAHPKSKPHWTPGVVIDRDQAPRSYLVLVEKRQYRRNRYHLRPLPITVPDEDSDSEAGDATESQSAIPDRTTAKAQERSKPQKQSSPPWYDKKSGRVNKAKSTRRGRNVNPVQPYQVQDWRKHRS